MKSEINSIAERLARAREVKGMLCINTRKTNTGTWKTPKLDQALRNLSGHKGGETNMRFYMKFPIYRPRGHGHPDVDDDIQKVWDDQLHPQKNAFYTTEEYRKIKQGGPFDDQGPSKLFYNTSDSFRMQQSRRSNSLVNDVYTKLRDVSNGDGRSLKLAGRNTITFPKRERFNEDAD